MLSQQPVSHALPGRASHGCVPRGIQPKPTNHELFLRDISRPSRRQIRSTPARQDLPANNERVKAHRMASSLRAKKGAWASDRASKGRCEPLPGRVLRDNVPKGAKLHAVTYLRGRPIRFFITAGQVSDYTRARTLLANPPNADCLLGDRGYDADWFREALVNINAPKPEPLRVVSYCR